MPFHANLRVSSLWLVSSLLVVLAGTARAQGVAADAEPGDLALGHAETPDGLARATLVTGQTVNGILLGTELCLALECDDLRAWVGSVATGGAAGLGLSLWLTSDGVTHGQSLAVNLGTLWGNWNGLLLAEALELDEPGPAFAVIMSGQVLGFGTGAYLAARTEPFSGDVAQASLLGTWSGAITLFIAGVAGELDDAGSGLWWSLLGVSNAGFIAGTQLHRIAPMSQGRVRIIDAGGIVGMLLGMGVDVLIEGDDVNTAPLMGGALLGSLTGLAVTTFLTRDYDQPARVVDVAAAPLSEGGAQVTIGLTF